MEISYAVEVYGFDNDSDSYEWHMLESRFASLNELEESEYLKYFQRFWPRWRIVEIKIIATNVPHESALFHGKRSSA